MLTVFICVYSCADATDFKLYGYIQDVLYFRHVLLWLLYYIDVHCTKSEKSQFHFLFSLFILRADFLVTVHVVVEKTCTV